MSQETPNPREAVIDKAANDLIEHFDSVLILASYHDGTTKWVHKQAGNHFASFGLAHEWITMENEITKHEARKDIE